MASTTAQQTMNLSEEAQVLQEMGIMKPPKNILDVHKNPLLISILDAVDTLKAMEEKKQLPFAYIQNAKGLLTMKTDKVHVGLFMIFIYFGNLRFTPGTYGAADWFWPVCDSRIWPCDCKGAQQAQWLVGEA